LGWTRRGLTLAARRFVTHMRHAVRKDDAAQQGAVARAPEMMAVSISMSLRAGAMIGRTLSDWSLLSQKEAIKVDAGGSVHCAGLLSTHRLGSGRASRIRAVPCTANPATLRLTRADRGGGGLRMPEPRPRSRHRKRLIQESAIAGSRRAGLGADGNPNPNGMPPGIRECRTSWRIAWWPRPDR
jgi:hypothetical protein